MQPPNRRFFKPRAGQIHGDPNFKANLFNQQAQGTKGRQNKGKGLVQGGAGDMPGQCDKDET